MLNFPVNPLVTLKYALIYMYNSSNNPTKVWHILDIGLQARECKSHMTQKTRLRAVFDARKADQGPKLRTQPLLYYASKPWLPYP